MSYEFEEGYKIRDQAATHFLLFLSWDGLIFLAASDIGILFWKALNFAGKRKHYESERMLSCLIIYTRYGQRIRLISATWYGILKHLPAKPLQLP